MPVNKFILEDSRANILVVEEAKNVAMILEIKDELPDLKKIVQFIGTPAPHPDVISWKELMELGSEQVPIKATTFFLNKLDRSLNVTMYMKRSSFLLMIPYKIDSRVTRA